MSSGYGWKVEELDWEELAINEIVAVVCKWNPRTVEPGVSLALGIVLIGSCKSQ